MSEDFHILVLSVSIGEILEKASSHLIGQIYRTNYLLTSNLPCLVEKLSSSVYVFVRVK